MFLCKYLKNSILLCNRWWAYLLISFLIIFLKKFLFFESNAEDLSFLFFVANFFSRIFIYLR